MTRPLVLLIALVLLPVVGASAEAPAQGGGRGGGVTPYPQGIDLAAAKRMEAAAESAAIRLDQLGRTGWPERA